MRKLKLASEDLTVETFDAGSAEDRFGTVQGQALLDTPNPGCNPDVTLVLTGVCIRNCHA